MNFEVPFFVFQGENDVVTLTEFAAEYFVEVEAPSKALALIKDAGHFAAFTQPERFLEELLIHVRPVAWGAAAADIGRREGGAAQSLQAPTPALEAS